MIKFYDTIRKILLNNTLGNYKINKTIKDTNLNLKTFSILENKLIGGSKEYSIEYLDEKYIFHELDDKYSSVKSLILLAKDNDNNCVVLTIDKSSNIASIDNLTSTNLKCSTTLINEVGKHLVKITLSLIKKYNYKFNIKRILLTDNSFIFCESIKKNINLADLQVLKSGQTFYGSLGFRPYNDDIEMNKKLERKYKNNIKIIDELKVIDSKIISYFNKYIKKYGSNIDLEELIKFTKENQNIKLKEFIKIISTRELFNTFCNLFDYIVPKIMGKNKLTSFNKQLFYLDII